MSEPSPQPIDEWGEPLEDLPRRPRRRLLGVGANPIALALLGVLLIACGFIGGVLVQKGQSSSSSSGGAAAAGLASRFAALREGAGAGAIGTSTGGASAGASGASGASGAAGFFGRSGGGTGAGTTAGQVAYLSGDTLYVSTAEGNTVKVTTSPASTVTKTVKAQVKGIHPGETVLVTGTADKNGTISAESIRVGGSGGAGGGAGTGSGGEPALFGKGG